MPGYQAPAERTTGPGARVVTCLMGILDSAYRAGRLAAPDAAVAHPALAADFEAIRGALVWTSIFGAVSFEVFGQYGADTFSAPDELFQHHVDMLARVAGFD